MHFYDMTVSSNDKVYIAWIDFIPNDPYPYQVKGAYGKRTADVLTVQPKGKFTTLSDAEFGMRKLAGEKLKKGYLDVEGRGYAAAHASHVRITLEQLMAKIDTTRLIGYSDQSSTVSSVVTVTEQQPNGPARAGRSIRI